MYTRWFETYAKQYDERDMKVNKNWDKNNAKNDDRLQKREREIVCVYVQMRRLGNLQSFSQIYYTYIIT